MTHFFLFKKVTFKLKTTCQLNHVLYQETKVHLQAGPVLEAAPQDHQEVKKVA
jgi:hypothetical protein